VRHGETAWNAEQRVQGQLDPGLNEQGREQSRAVARRLAGVKLNAVYSSDLKRAAECGQAIATSHGLEPVLAKELRERHFGALQGYTLAEAAQECGTWYDAWARDRLNQAPPAGETLAEMTERVMEFIWQVVEERPGEKVAVVTHGGPIKALVYEMLGISQPFWRKARVANGSLTVLEGYVDNLSLVSFNETGHLEGLAPPTPDEAMG
jgi:broad specificity phosphatase PhoE